MAGSIAGQTSNKAIGKKTQTQAKAQSKRAKSNGSVGLLALLRRRVKSISSAWEGGLWQRLRQHLHILPNTATSAALFCAFFSILCSASGNFVLAAKCVFLSFLFDGIDGRIARYLRVSSAFGGQYDSLADLVSFGVAPGILVYLWALKDLGFVGLGVSFTYIVCCAVRLARFNTNTSGDPRFFSGLPSPSGGCLVSGMIWSLDDHASPSVKYLALIMTLMSAYMMVCGVRFLTFKKTVWSDHYIILSGLAALLGACLLYFRVSHVLWAIFLLSSAYGPVMEITGIGLPRDVKTTD